MTDGQQESGEGPGAGSGPDAAADIGADRHGEITIETMAERLKERIYATITMVAVTMSLSADDQMGSIDAAAVIVVTSLGLWLATVVADQQAYKAVHLHRASRREVRRLLFVSSPLLLSATAPLIMVVFHAFGVLSLRAAMLIGAAVGVGSLFSWSFHGVRRMGGGLLSAAVAGIADMAIGAGVAIVKYVAGH